MLHNAAMLQAHHNVIQSAAEPWLIGGENSSLVDMASADAHAVHYSTSFKQFQSPLNFRFVCIRQQRHAQQPESVAVNVYS